MVQPGVDIEPAGLIVAGAVIGESRDFGTDHGWHGSCFRYP
jgi:hypothetical protein